MAVRENGRYKRYWARNGVIYDVCGVSYCNLASLYEWLGKEMVRMPPMDRDTR